MQTTGRLYNTSTSEDREASDSRMLNQTRSGRVWHPKYDKAHEAMPKVGYYQLRDPDWW